MPTKAGLYAIALIAADMNSSMDLTKLLLRVSYYEPMAITTVGLPDAFTGVDYAVKLSHNRNAESASVTFSLPCVQRPKQGGGGGYECVPLGPTSGLPDGLKLDPDGTLSGTPTGSQDAGVSFLVAVADDAGRNLRSLSIEAPTTTKGRGGGARTLRGPLAALLMARPLARLGSGRWYPPSLTKVQSLLKNTCSKHFSRSLCSRRCGARATRTSASRRTDLRRAAGLRPR